MFGVGACEYKLVREPSSELLEQVYQFRARAWKARTSRFSPEVDAWRDALDEASMHFVACSPDEKPIAAARLTITNAISQGPDSEVYADLDAEAFATPVAFISRLVVCPDHAGKGLTQMLDEMRLKEAREIGCRTVLAATSAGEWRIRQLEGYGFVRLFVANVQASGPLVGAYSPTILALLM